MHCVFPVPNFRSGARQSPRRKPHTRPVKPQNHNRLPISTARLLEGKARHVLDKPLFPRCVRKLYHHAFSLGVLVQEDTAALKLIQSGRFCGDEPWGFQWNRVKQVNNAAHLVEVVERFIQQNEQINVTVGISLLALRARAAGRRTARYWADNSVLERPVSVLYTRFPWPTIEPCSFVQ